MADTEARAADDAAETVAPQGAQPESIPPAPGSGPGGRGRALRVPLLLLAFAVMASWNIRSRDFWGDEAVQAQVTREMKEASGSLESWLVPTLGGSPYLARPPLTCWLSTLCALIPGLDPHFAYRLPNVAFAVFALWLTFQIGRRLFDEPVAFLAMLIQGSTLLFFIDAAWLGCDLVFACFVELALGGMFLAMKDPGCTRAAWIGWLGLAGASLTKSPLVAGGLVLGTFALFCFLDGGMAKLKAGLARTAPRKPVLVSVALISSWYVYICAGTEYGPTLLEQHWQRQHVEPFSSDGPDARSPFYYLVTIFVVFLPWSVFLPLGILHAKDRTSRYGQRACLMWFFFILIALSVVSAKRPSCLLTLLPAISLLTAAGFTEKDEHFSLWEGYLRDQLFRAVPWVLKAPAIAALLLAVASLLGLQDRLEISWLKELLADEDRREMILILLTIGAVAAWITAERLTKEVKQPDCSRRVVELVRASAFLLFIGSFLLPAIDPVQSARRFLSEVNSTVGGAKLATYGADRPALFYLEAQSFGHFEQLSTDVSDRGSESKLEGYLASGKKVYLLAAADEVDGLQTQFPGTFSRMTEIRRGRMGIHGEFVLLSSKKP